LALHNPVGHFSTQPQDNPTPHIYMPNLGGGQLILHSGKHSIHDKKAVCTNGCITQL